MTQELSIKVTPRLISDRKELIKYKLKHGVKDHRARTDMYWLDVRVTGYNLAAKVTYSVDFYIDSVGAMKWTLTGQYGLRFIYDEHVVKQTAYDWWERSAQKKKAELWVQNLIDAGAV